MAELTDCVGLVGCGRWGQKHLNVLQHLRSSGVLNRLVVCDTDSAALVNLDVDATYTTLDDMVNNETLDAAAVVTPPNTHLTIMAVLAGHGIPLLVEKPLSDDQVAVERVLDRLSANATLFVGFLLRHHPSVQRLHETVVKGDLGRLKSFEYRRTTVRAPPVGANALSTLAVHGLDLLTFMTGAPLMDGEVETFLTEPTSALVVIRMGNGTHGTIEVAWDAKEERRLVAVEGEFGRGEVDFGTGMAHIVVNGTTTASPPPQRSALEEEWLTFLSAVEAADPHVHPPAAVLRDQAMWLARHGAFNIIDSDLHGCEN